MTVREHVPRQHGPQQQGGQGPARSGAAQVRSAPSRNHFSTVSAQGEGLKSGSPAVSRNVFLSNDVGISLRKGDPQTHNCILCFHIAYKHQDMGVQCDISHSLNKTFKNMNTFLVNYAIWLKLSILRQTKPGFHNKDQHEYN